MIDTLESILRLLLGFSLAFLVGLERQLRRKPVGFGTFTFVATGACALAILALDLEGDNPLPLLGGVITGIGFLGAGSLIRSQDRVFGFTTAALIWAMAAMGLAVGAGIYPLGLAFYGMVWLVIVADRVLELHGFGSHARVLHLTLANPLDLGEVQELLPPRSTHYERFMVDKENSLLRVTAQVRIKPAEVGGLLKGLEGSEKVRSIELE